MSRYASVWWSEANDGQQAKGKSTMTYENPLGQNPLGQAPPRGPSPFAGIPVSDWVRDGAALVLLLVSFAMPWNFASFATGRIEVILITLLSVFSLSITYLARTGVFPPTTTVQTVWTLRLVANAPYAALVLTYIIIDVVSGAGYVSGGVGLAAAFGLAGALLAAQPREAEVRSLQHGASVGEVWYRITAVIGSIMILASVASLIIVLIRISGPFTSPVVLAVLAASLLVNLAGIAALYAGILRRSEIGRLVALAVGIVVLGIILVDLFTRFAITVGGVESLHAVGFGALAISAVAGLASSPGLRLAMTPADDLARWFKAAAAMLIVIVVLAAFLVLLNALALVSVAGLDSSFTGFGIGSIVSMVGVAIVAVIARTVLRTNPATNRPLVLVLLGLIVVLGIVHVVLATIGSQVGTIDLVVAFGLPLAVAVYLTAPLPVRGYYAAVSPRAAAAQGPLPSFVDQVNATGQVPPYAPETVVRAAPAAPATPVAPAPAAPPPAPAAPVAGVAQALDPSTPSEVLFQLATSDPALRPYLAANPSTYPELLAWLGSLGDPAVDEALRARGVR